MENIISCAADGAPVMVGKKNGVLTVLKDDTPQMLLVHCVIHRHNLFSQKVFPLLNETLSAVIKCINTIKAKCERLVKLFCKDQMQTM